MNFNAARVAAERTKMKPSKFPQANTTLLKPPSMTDEECGELHVHRCINQESTISCWRPTRRERFAIFFGRPVWLWVFGYRQPPVSIEVADPFKVDIHA